MGRGSEREVLMWKEGETRRSDNTYTRRWSEVVREEMEEMKGGV